MAPINKELMRYLKPSVSNFCLCNGENQRLCYWYLVKILWIYSFIVLFFKMFYIFIILTLMIFDIDVLTLKSHPWKGIKLLRATRGTRNRNVQVVISHASHVCSQHSFALPLRRNRNAQKLIWSRVFRASTPRNLITRVLNICHVKFTQSTALE